MKDKIAEIFLTAVDWIMDKFTGGVWSSRQGDETGPVVK